MNKWILLSALFIVPGLAFAHKPSDSYVTLEVNSGQIGGAWDIALKDLEIAVGLDENSDNQITWGELRNHHDAIEAYAQNHISLSTAGGKCRLTFLPQSVINYSDGAYGHLPLIAVCPEPETPLKISYSAFFDFDPLHRGILKFTSSNGTEVRVLSPQQSEQLLSTKERSGWLTAKQFFTDGVWHLISGYDHLLFLLALLLACLGSRRADKEASEGRIAGISAIKIVTAFTLAHSITLSLAVLKIFSLPSQLVESLIAATVFIAAINVFFAIIDERKLWTVTFFFGLIHGFGFASVLLDLKLPPSTLATALASFNIGVEVAQLTLIGIFLPLALIVRNWRYYDLLFKKGGSVTIMILSAYWFMQRVFNL